MGPWTVGSLGASHLNVGTFKSTWVLAGVLAWVLGARGLLAQAPAALPQSGAVQEVNRDQAPATRIPQQKVVGYAALQGMVLDTAGRPVPGAQAQLTGMDGRALPSVGVSGDGIFRMLRIPPGMYRLVVTRMNGAGKAERPEVELKAGEVLSVEIHLAVVMGTFTQPIPQAMQELDEQGYKELSRRPDADGAVVVPQEVPLPAAAANFQPQRDRWEVPFPSYRRYGGNGESPYVLGHWYDPFNRNVLKADKPLFGRTFFEFTGDSITAAEGRRLPTPSGQSTESVARPQFFGKGGAFFVAETVRATFDLSHGDTPSFKPVDWRVRVTPTVNVNYLRAREYQVVGPDVRQGTTRVDAHFGLQEAFGEVKLHDLSPNYDFVNVRVGIQQFVSDFRGFIFAEEQPGVRIFGNLKSNRVQFNLAGFDLLEKDTNSGLNTFHRRGREVALANVFIQDFLTEGYTAQFSYHFVRDQASTYYDENGRIERPAPIGNVIPHRVDANYYGWTGDGHIGKYNIDHAFYQVTGTDQFSQLAGKRVDINAQFAAAELSQDHDFYRLRASFLYASGDDDPRDGTARGFSSIVDGVAFAGGEFSFFNREGIPLTRAGVALTAPDSFLPDLRASKDEGQSNFVNPGLYLYNVGTDVDVTPKLRIVGNVNFLQFARTQPLIFLLQQNGIRRTIGIDSGVGALYRPLLSDNIVIHAGITGLAPFRGLRDIYTSQVLLSGFVVVKFQF